jgi:hypothetical protein
MHGVSMQDLSEKEKRQVREATRVVARMLCVHPRDRPSCEELLRDKFFTDETSVEALRTTPPEKLKGVGTDLGPGAANDNGMYWVCAVPRVPVAPSIVTFSAMGNEHARH